MPYSFLRQPFAARWKPALWPIIPAAIFALILGAVQPVFAQPVEGGLDQAMRQYVENRGEGYAGFCSETEVPDHVGLWCSNVESQSDNTTVVAFGPTFSEFTVRVRFERNGQIWQVVDEEPIAQTEVMSPPTGRQHEVRSGDTLFSIAQRFDTTVEALAERNNIDNMNLIIPSQVLVIPGSETAPPTDSLDAVCLQGSNFVEDGPIASFDRGASDARLVLDYRLGVHVGCERLAIDLGTPDETAAAETGPVEAEFLRDQGVVRVHLGPQFDLAELVGTATDADLDGRLIDRAFLVRSFNGLNGQTYIDVHLAAPALAQVFVLDSPARIVVDVQPNGGPLPAPAAVANNVVVLEPRSGDPPATAAYPLTIRGYARTFEANVVARIRSNGQVAADDSTTAAAWAETWGGFELTVENGPPGEIELFVGELSARDGSEEGVYIPLDMN